MPEAIADPLPQAPRKRIPITSLILPPLMLYGFMMMGGDITALVLRPLKELQIPYPRILDSAFLIGPGLGVLLWLVTLRRWPRAGSILAVILAWAAISFVPNYAESRVARVAIGRLLSIAEQEDLTTRLGIRTFQQSQGVEHKLFISPQNEAAARAELDRMGIMLPSGTNRE